MLCHSKKIINLPVETQDGQQIGRVDDFVFETDSQTIWQYIVKAQGLSKRILKENMLINRGQVLEITAKKIIVDNEILKDSKEQEKKPTKKATRPALN